MLILIAAHWIWGGWVETMTDGTTVNVGFGFLRQLGAIDFAGMMSTYLQGVTLLQEEQWCICLQDFLHLWRAFL